MDYVLSVKWKNCWKTTDRLAIAMEFHDDYAQEFVMHDDNGTDNSLTVA